MEEKDESLNELINERVTEVFLEQPNYTRSVNKLGEHNLDVDVHKSRET